ncbi:hypothetical protein HAX54_045600 [Datura stramonium]|uniref:Uncharacterized protein n=1 Tax=Datura stramonium TaxID=4076 RepID=A0ABS8WI91_DATST|nr:hypothetical protein [Datura stramonium]
MVFRFRNVELTLTIEEVLASYEILAGLRGTHPYMGRVLRQLGMRQETPQVGEMTRYITEHEEGVVTLKDMIVRGWRQRKFGEPMVKNRFKPKCSYTYKEKLKKNLAGILVPGLNEPTQIADNESKHQIQLHRLQDKYQESEISHRRQHWEDALTIHHLREELKSDKQELEDARHCLIELDDCMNQQVTNIEKMSFESKAQLAGVT